MIKMNIKKGKKKITSSSKGGELAPKRDLLVVSSIT